MVLQLYNTMTRQLEDFEPLRARTVRMYSCGPTVYDYAHVGNLRQYIFADTLKRTLKLFGMRVKHVMNITDVGHLVSNEDEGEDKMIVAARREDKTAWVIARLYTAAFLKDMMRLNILKPTAMPRATDHLREQIELVRQLEERGFTYTISDGVYFDTARFVHYGRLGGQSLEDKKAGARVAVKTEKRNVTDFALWKFSPAGIKRDMEWDSPWGKGFPGWHVECSAMSRAYLGQPFDIHTGGIDHIPVHHENEIAQSEAAYEKALARFWLHGEFLMVEGRRMGKSEGNLLRLDDLIAKGFDPLAFRLQVLGAHYRTKMNFTWDALKQAQGNLAAIRDFVEKLKLVVRSHRAPARDGLPAGALESVRRQFETALARDLNTPQALACMTEFFTQVNALFDTCALSQRDARSALQLLRALDSVLGVLRRSVASSSIRRATALVRQRERLRKKKKFDEADALRTKIIAQGYYIEDTPYGPFITGKQVP